MSNTLIIIIQPQKIILHRFSRQSFKIPVSGWHRPEELWSVSRKENTHVYNNRKGKFLQVHSLRIYNMLNILSPEPTAALSRKPADCCIIISVMDKICNAWRLNTTKIILYTSLITFFTHTHTHTHKNTNKQWQLNYEILTFFIGY